MSSHEVTRVPPLARTIFFLTEVDVRVQFQNVSKIQGLKAKTRELTWTFYIYKTHTHTHTHTHIYIYIYIFGAYFVHIIM